MYKKSILTQLLGALVLPPMLEDDDSKEVNKSIKKKKD
jgi:hypothetical protein